MVVVWSEACYLHCPSEVTFSIAESGACVQKLLRNMNVIIGGASTIRGGKKLRGRYGTEQGQPFIGEMALKGWTVPLAVAKGVA